MNKSAQSMHDSAHHGHDEVQKDALTLDQIRLQIGDLVQIQPASEEARYYVNFVGYVKGNCFIVSNPVSDGKLVFVKEGQALIIRFFSGKSAYAFGAVVTRVTTVPFPHLYLSYPKEIRSMVVRKNERMKTQISGKLQFQGGEWQECVVQDISMSGALLAVHEEIGKIGDEFRLAIETQVNQTPFTLTVDCKIRSTSSHDQADNIERSYDRGVSFNQLSGQDVLVLTALLYQSLADHS